MGLTQEEIHKISKYSKLLTEEIQREDEKKYAEIRLRELESQIRNEDTSLDVLWTARRMTRDIISLFTNRHKELVSSNWLPSPNDHDYHEYRYRGLTRETIFKRITEKHSSWSKEEEAQFDQILRVLVENNFIQYNCYSTVCHYKYRVKK